MSELLALSTNDTPCTTLEQWLQRLNFPGAFKLVLLLHNVVTPVHMLVTCLSLYMSADEKKLRASMELELNITDETRPDQG